MNDKSLTILSSLLLASLMIRTIGAPALVTIDQQQVKKDSKGYERDLVTLKNVLRRLYGPSKPKTMPSVKALRVRSNSKNNNEDLLSDRIFVCRVNSKPNVLSDFLIGCRLDKLDVHLDKFGISMGYVPERGHPCLWSKIYK
jgi:hypothetical protein